MKNLPWSRVAVAAGAFCLLGLLKPALLPSLLFFLMFFALTAFPTCMLLRPFEEAAVTESGRAFLGFFCVLVGLSVGLVVGGLHDTVLGAVTLPKFQLDFGLFKSPLGLIVGPILGIAINLAYHASWRRAFLQRQQPTTEG